VMVLPVTIDDVSKWTMMRWRHASRHDKVSDLRVFTKICIVTVFDDSTVDVRCIEDDLVDRIGCLVAWVWVWICKSVDGKGLLAEEGRPFCRGGRKRR
jgi:hypothetical protein